MQGYPSVGDFIRFHEQAKGRACARAAKDATQERAGASAIINPSKGRNSAAAATSANSSDSNSLNGSNSNSNSSSSIWEARGRIIEQYQLQSRYSRNHGYKCACFSDGSHGNSNGATRLGCCCDDSSRYACTGAAGTPSIRERYRSYAGVPDQALMLVLCPGSREAEVDGHLQVTILAALGGLHFRVGMC